MSKSKCNALFLAVATALLLTSACLAYNQGDPEVRGMWVQNTGYSNSTQTINTVNTLASGNFNVVCMYARYYGFLFFPPTPPDAEPQYISYNALDDMIAKAHAQGLQVHAWFWAEHIAATQYSSKSHVQNKHPEWLLKNSTGGVSIYWLDPGVPDAMTWNYNVAMDIVANHDVDGLHFDYIRYPYPSARNYGYNDVAVARFNEEFGRTGVPDPNDSTWVAWRERQVTEFVKKVYANAVAVKPNVIISAAVWGNPSSGHAVLQDWVTWLQKGYLDMAVPMIYEPQSSNSYYQSCVNSDVSVANGRAMVIGQGGGDNPIGNTIWQMNYARSRGCPGEFIFSWKTSNNQGYSVGDFCTALAADPTAYSTPVSMPAMPWKTTEGIIKGTVTRPGGGIIYNATITINSKTDRTDGTGFYAVMRLNPGTCTVTCQANGYAPASTEVSISAGAVTTQDFSLSFDGPPPDIVVDNNNANNSGGSLSSVSGSWPVVSDLPAMYATDYAYTARVSPPGNVWYKWTPNILVPGDYNVYVWYPQDPAGTRCTGVPYSVYYNGGSQMFAVNEHVSCGTWNLLGKFSFAGGTSGYVKMDNGSNASGNVIVADAVKFVYVPDTTPPSAPTGLSATVIGPYEVDLSWTPSTDNVGVAGYKIYRNSVQVGTSTTTTYADTKTSSGDTFSYQVSAYDAAGNESTRSNTATVTTPPVQDIIIDNPSASRIGTWTTATDAPTKYGDDYLLGACSPSTGRIVRWIPDIDIPGLYQVSVWYPADTNRSTKAPYTIVYSGGSTTVQVNQTTGGGQWHVLGLLPFVAGTSGYVQLSNGTGESASTYICADAARFQYMRPLDTIPPSISSVAVAPPLVSGGVPVSVSVSVTDDVGVASVTASGTTLSLTGPNTFTGSIATDPALGEHVVSVLAADAAGNQTTSTIGSYITAPVYGIANAALLSGGPADAASVQTLFKTWGSVTVQDDNYFTLSDGSPTGVRVYCPGHGLTTGRFVTVVGIWNPLAVPAELEVQPAQIQIIY